MLGCSVVFLLCCVVCYLASKIEDLGIIIEEGNDDACGGIEALPLGGLRQIPHIPDGQLPLPHLGESR